jgi:CelD/BcsL family acetyltransferase involved in cellulose biosynthesis
MREEMERQPLETLVHVHDLERDFDAIMTCRRRYRQDISRDTVHFGEPEWLRQWSFGDGSVVRFVSAEQGGQIVGMIPFVEMDFPLECRVGPWELGAVPFKRLRLLGGAPEFPAPLSTRGDLLAGIVRAMGRSDGVYLECLRTDSWLWRHVTETDRLRGVFKLHCLRGPVRRPFVRVDGSFKEYMGKFSAKTRETWRRKARHLQREGDVRLVAVRSPEEVDRFLDAAMEVSRKTYQFSDLGLGLRHRERLENRMRLAAQRGWLRSYLLQCGPHTTCFMVGYQAGGRFYYADVGYDPAWSRFGAGTTLLLQVIEDLFERARPDTMNFGVGGEYKWHFANDSYEEVDALLVRRRPYPLLAATVHGLCGWVSGRGARAVETLGRFGLRPLRARAAREERPVGA